MTCIVAYKENDTIYMAGDSASTSRGITYATGLSKVFCLKKEFLIGYCGSFRMGQILEYSFKPPKRKEGMSDLQYLVKKFIPALIKSFDEERHLVVENNEAKGGYFLLGYRGSIYSVQSDFQVNTHLGDYAAEGSGEDHAMGALYALQYSELEAVEKLTVALDAASAYVDSVCGPYCIMSLDKEGATKL